MPRKRPDYQLHLDSLGDVTPQVVIREQEISPVYAEPKNEQSSPYKHFYSALGTLREEFHRIGRFDDANAKLDEVCKLLVLKVLDERHPPPGGGSRLTAENLRNRARIHHKSPTRLAAAMHDVFEEIATLCPAELEAFGAHRKLNLNAEDDEFAAALVPLLESFPTALHANDKTWSFDGVNEAFGHFVQDSFRNRKEDAQYMTPPEVVTAVVDMAFQDILADLVETPRKEPLLVADPTCGVGSFLAAAYRHACHVQTSDGPMSDRLELFGQDKVERMSRLANVNLHIFANARATIRTGNSILPPSSLDDIAGRVDLIITNPPFGATFNTTDLLGQARPDQFPTLFALTKIRALPKTLDSEYLLLDREIALLRPGGRLLMVVPDHVVSGGGFSEHFRLMLSRHTELIAVLDLPTETFAQAGTRTRTSVIYLRRPITGHISTVPQQHVFMATSTDLGFRVVSRTGASVKKIVGSSDLNVIVDAYREFRKIQRTSGDIVCLSKSPSVAAVPHNRLLNNRWTAGFYQTARLAALQELERNGGGDITCTPLTEIAEVDPDLATRVLADDRTRCISVLHVREDGCIDLQAVDSYRPTTACVRCRAGDVLLSKINPRIMRVCVVPETPWELGCSPEFAVLRTTGNGLTPWALALLLRSDAVQSQVRTLTSGTSSSHNRIKDRDLLAITIPMPQRDGAAAAQLTKLAEQYASAMTQQYLSMRLVFSCYRSLETLIGASV